MSAIRAGTSVISRQAIWMSVRADSSSVCEGVTSRKPPLPLGFGKMLPSISQKAFRTPYSVLFGTETITGRREYSSSSNSSHMLADSAMWVSASITTAMMSSAAAIDRRRPSIMLSRRLVRTQHTQRVIDVLLVHHLIEVDQALLGAELNVPLLHLLQARPVHPPVRVEPRPGHAGVQRAVREPQMRVQQVDQLR